MKSVSLHLGTILPRSQLAYSCTITLSGEKAIFRGGHVRQGVRFFVKPNAFVNQLQWSSHHTWLLLAFLIVAGVEAHVGRNHIVLETFGEALSFRLGVSKDIGTWLIVSLKLASTLIGASLISLAVWFVGTFLGHSSSQRVLFRRLSVVFTLFLTAYTSTHLTHIYPWMETASLFIFFWAALLGFFTLREQFGLGFIETAFVGGFALLLVMTTWHYSNTFLEAHAKSISQQIAYRPIQLPSFGEGVSTPSKSRR